jgi:hypothetical protein
MPGLREECVESTRKLSQRTNTVLVVRRLLLPG